MIIYEAEVASRPEELTTRDYGADLGSARRSCLREGEMELDGFGRRESAAAASRLVLPCATISATCSSCGVSDRWLPPVSREGFSPVARNSVRA